MGGDKEHEGTPERNGAWGIVPPFSTDALTLSKSRGVDLSHHISRLVPTKFFDIPECDVIPL